jgi:hypothetical protein
MDGTGNPCTEITLRVVGETGLEPATPGPPDQYLFLGVGLSSVRVVLSEFGWKECCTP